MNAYDCIVLGIGGFGSGVVDCLARRGVKVLGLEQFGPVHERGSSHGETRIIRKAYFEHPDYVPLCVKAYELWDALEADVGKSLKTLTGLMLAGPDDGEAVSGARLSASQHGLPLEELTAEDAMRRYAGFRIPEELSVVFEADAGFLRVEDCVRAHIERAERHGATLKFNEAVHSWQSDGKTVRVETGRATYEAANLVITAGAWAAQVLANLNLSLEVRRKPQFWHPIESPAYNLDAGCPGYLFELPTGVFYGFPSLDGRVKKVAEHSGGKVVFRSAKARDEATPTATAKRPFAERKATMDGNEAARDLLADHREITQADTAPVENFVANCLPGVKNPAVRHSLCMYTMTPDSHFIVDRHPEYDNVVLGAGFSGHGFKFTNVLGEAMADLALDGRTALPVGFLGLDRPSLRTSSVNQVKGDGS